MLTTVFIFYENNEGKNYHMISNFKHPLCDIFFKKNYKGNKWGRGIWHRPLPVYYATEIMITKYFEPLCDNFFLL